MGYCIGLRAFSGVFSAAIFLLVSFVAHADTSLIAHWPLEDGVGISATTTAGNKSRRVVCNSPMLPRDSGTHPRRTQYHSRGEVDK